MVGERTGDHRASLPARIGSSFADLRSRGAAKDPRPGGGSFIRTSDSASGTAQLTPSSSGTSTWGWSCFAMPAMAAPAEDDDVGAILCGQRPRRLDDGCPHALRIAVDRGGRALDRAEPGEAGRESERRDMLAVEPGRAEDDEAEARADHQGREHRGLGHAHDGNVEHLARRIKRGVVGDREDHGVHVVSVPRGELQHHMRGNGVLGARVDDLGAELPCRRNDGGAGRRHGPRCGGAAFGDRTGQVGIEDEDAHEARLLAMKAFSMRGDVLTAKLKIAPKFCAFCLIFRLLAQRNHPAAALSSVGSGFAGPRPGAQSRRRGISCALSSPPLQAFC